MVDGAGRRLQDSLPARVCLPPPAGEAIFVADGLARRLGRLARVEGPAITVLAAERTALNLVQRLSGIATATRAFIDALRGTKAVLLDTRKTVPGLRLFERYAVRCGGGTNHRFGLAHGFLVKDNHADGAGSVWEATRRVATSGPEQTFGDPPQRRARTGRSPSGPGAGAERILLDNADR
jgi:nicotinate-nucleotide pyrophosphorylase (carboxylating)